MARDLTAAALAAAQAQNSELIHLLSLAFSGGTIRFTTGPHDVTWAGDLYSAAGSAMTFEAVSESTDSSAQRLKLTLDGVSLDAVTALLAEGYIGREGRLYRAHIGVDGQIIDDPILLFLGLMNAPWEVNEDPDEGSATVETELVSPLALFDQVRGITADVNSHQAHFAGDTFFSHIVNRQDGDFGWGVSQRTTAGGYE